MRIISAHKLYGSVLQAILPVNSQPHQDTCQSRDVGQPLWAVFVPLIRSRMIRSRTTTTEERLMVELPKSLNAWKPFQVTLSERRSCPGVAKTLFNLLESSVRGLGDQYWRNAKTLEQSRRRFNHE